MKYSEFKAEVEKMGFEVGENHNAVVAFRESDGLIIGKVYKQTTSCLDTKWSSFVLLKDNEKNELLDLFTRLAKTPLAEREEEKRYWLQKIPVPLLDKECEKKWLWKYTGTAPSNMFGVDTTKIDSELYKTIFTESEIAEMDITGFDKIEVSND